MFFRFLKQMEGIPSRCRLTMAAVVLWVLVTGSLVDSALGVANKCSACRAVAGEIEASLAKERPRNHLDMRHRLDSKGSREGKVIDYKVSELRVVELLEGLCAKFKSYTLQQDGTDEGGWTSVDVDRLSDIERQQAEAYSKELISYCGRLMETTDDELTSNIQKGVMKVGTVEAVLCVELTKHCTSPKLDTVSLGVAMPADSGAERHGEL